MTKLILIFCLFFGSNALAIENDKAKHFVASAGLTAIGTIGFIMAGYEKDKAIYAAGFMALFIGILKETVIDNKADGGDMVANLLGTAAVVVPVLMIEF